MRREQDLGRAQGALNGATRNRMVGGVVLLIGMIALIGFVVIGSLFAAGTAAVALFMGSMMFIMDGSGGDSGHAPLN